MAACGGSFAGVHRCPGNASRAQPCSQGEGRGTCGRQELVLGGTSQATARLPWVVPCWRSALGSCPGAGSVPRWLGEGRLHSSSPSHHRASSCTWSACRGQGGGGGHPGSPGLRQVGPAVEGPSGPGKDDAPLPGLLPRLRTSSLRRPSPEGCPGHHWPVTSPSRGPWGGQVCVVGIPHHSKLPRRWRPEQTATALTAPAAAAGGQAIGQGPRLQLLSGQPRSLALSAPPPSRGPFS